MGQRNSGTRIAVAGASDAGHLGLALLQAREAATAHSRCVGGAIFASLRRRRCKPDKSQRQWATPSARLRNGSACGRSTAPCARWCRRELSSGAADGTAPGRGSAGRGAESWCGGMLPGVFPSRRHAPVALAVFLEFIRQTPRADWCSVTVFKARCLAVEPTSRFSYVVCA